ncbi:hypothetical protein NQZ68_027191 [Dissostichus eleginoides]|nr:hypothetical protein NQZ68_027191 [Dissostichus eleginoides]
MWEEEDKESTATKPTDAFAFALKLIGDLRSVFLWFCLWSLVEKRRRDEALTTDRTQESSSIPLALTQDSCPSLDQI